MIKIVSSRPEAWGPQQNRMRFINEEFTWMCNTICVFFFMQSFRIYKTFNFPVAYQRDNAGTLTYIL